MKKHGLTVKRVLWFILIGNALVSMVKLGIGILSHSAALVSDGLHSLSDGFSNIVGLIGMHYTEQPEDACHPYGHSKFEVLAATFIAGMMVVMAGNIILTAIERLFDPAGLMISGTQLWVLAATLILNVGIATLEYCVGKTLGSVILISDSLHTRSDVWVTLGVLAGLWGIRLGLPSYVDAIVAICVAVSILHGAYQIFKENSGVLLDGVGIEPEQIALIVSSFPEVRDVHKIRSRKTSKEVFIDMHVLVDPMLDVEISHDLMHRIETALRADINRNIQLICHVEPYHETLS